MNWIYCMLHVMMVFTVDLFFLFTNFYSNHLVVQVRKQKGEKKQQYEMYTLKKNVQGTITCYIVGLVKHKVIFVIGRQYFDFFKEGKLTS